MLNLLDIQRYGTEMILRNTRTFCFLMWKYFSAKYFWRKQFALKIQYIFNECMTLAIEETINEKCSI